MEKGKDPTIATKLGCGGKEFIADLVVEDCWD